MAAPLESCEHSLEPKSKKPVEKHWKDDRSVQYPPSIIVQGFSMVDEATNKRRNLNVQ